MSSRYSCRPSCWTPSREHVDCRNGPTNERLISVWEDGAGFWPCGALEALWCEHIVDIDLLIVVAAVAAAAVGAPFEGAVLLTLFSVSTTLEDRALGRARRAVESLRALRPETAFRKGPDGAFREVLAADLAVGDVVVLRPGARVPADGVIAGGHGLLDESSITGKSVPVSKEPRAQVFEATVNLDGVLEVTVTRPVAESTVARMIQLVAEAQAANAPSEQFSAWFGQRYTMAVMAVAALAFAAFDWLGRDWKDALYRAAILLVAASPCAIVVSVPAAILSALSAAARRGVLFKGGVALETLAAVDTFAFDKTGTLTTGKAVVNRVIALDGDDKEFLRLLSGLEAHSEHHSATAIRQEAARRFISPAQLEDVVTRPAPASSASRTARGSGQETGAWPRRRARPLTTRNWSRWRRIRRPSSTSAGIRSYSAH